MERSDYFVERSDYLWNEVTIFWNEVTVRWNEVTWNEVTMERSDRIPLFWQLRLATHPRVLAIIILLATQQKVALYTNNELSYPSNYLGRKTLNLHLLIAPAPSPKSSILSISSFPFHLCPGLNASIFN